MHGEKRRRSVAKQTGSRLATSGHGSVRKNGKSEKESTNETVTSEVDGNMHATVETGHAIHVVGQPQCQLQSQFQLQPQLISRRNRYRPTKTSKQPLSMLSCERAKISRTRTKDVREGAAAVAHEIVSRATHGRRTGRLKVKHRPRHNHRQPVTAKKAKSATSARKEKPPTTRLHRRYTGSDACAAPARMVSTDTCLEAAHTAAIKTKSETGWDGTRETRTGVIVDQPSLRLAMGERGTRVTKGVLLSLPAAVRRESTAVETEIATKDTTVIVIVTETGTESETETETETEIVTATATATVSARKRKKETETATAAEAEADHPKAGTVSVSVNGLAMEIVTEKEKEIVEEATEMNGGIVGITGIVIGREIETGRETGSIPSRLERDIEIERENGIESEIETETETESIARTGGR